MNHHYDANTAKEGKHIAKELQQLNYDEKHHHSSAAHRELQHIHQELQMQHKHLDPHSFSKLVHSIERQLPHNKHLGVEKNQHGQITHINFGHDDIYGHHHSSKKGETTGSHHSKSPGTSEHSPETNEHAPNDDHTAPLINQRRQGTPESLITPLVDTNTSAPNNNRTSPEINQSPPSHKQRAKESESMEEHFGDNIPF